MATDKNLRELLDMLAYKRPAFSRTEQAFIANYIMPFNAHKDQYGSRWVKVGYSPIMWSCHTDTRHTEDGLQTIDFGGDVANAPFSNCLGADDTVGVWLMINMIRANIPGLYIFHAYEEQDGYTGAEYIAQHLRHLFGISSTNPIPIEYAIAFDRYGTNEIITHQGGNRTASDEFGNQLIDLLRPLDYYLSDQGIWTDTAAYAGIIYECTNISAGFFGEHTPQEYLDTNHAMRLLDTVLSADWSSLTG